MSFVAITIRAFAAGTGIDMGADPEGADAMEPAGDIDVDGMDAELPTMDLDSPEGGTEGEPGLDREER